MSGGGNRPSEARQPVSFHNGAKSYEELSSEDEVKRNMRLFSEKKRFLIFTA